MRLSQVLRTRIGSFGRRESRVKDDNINYKKAVPN